MQVGVLKEPAGETRVSLLDEGVNDLVKLGIAVLVETGAGEHVHTTDQQYIEAGARIATRREILEQADLLLRINGFSPGEINDIPPGKVVIGMLSPLTEHDIVKALAERNITSFSMDFVPRTTRAQAMDVLSSMASVAGYKAVLRAAYELPHFFPMYITAAGSIKPSKVMILGAGVAGLQAIATARRLGAQVEVFDVRSAVKEEVMSLGAKFIEVEGAVEDKAAGGYAVEQTEEFKQKQAAVIQEHAKKADVIICTAQIPGKKAPVLITKETVAEMRPGSVIIDMAASSGGNCEGTENNKTVAINGIKVIGDSSLQGTMSIDASKMYGKNILNFMKLIIKGTDLHLNFEDDIVAGTCITHDGSVRNDRVRTLLN